MRKLKLLTALLAVVISVFSFSVTAGARDYDFIHNEITAALATSGSPNSLFSGDSKNETELIYSNTEVEYKKPIVITIPSGTTTYLTADLRYTGAVSGEFIVVDGPGNLVIENSNITGSTNEPLIKMRSGLASVTVTNSDISNSTGPALYLADSPLTPAIEIEGSTKITGGTYGVKIDDTNAVMTVDLTQGQALPANNGKISGKVGIETASDLTVTSGTIEGTGKSGAETYAAIICENANGYVRLSDCEVTGFDNGIITESSLTIEDAIIKTTYTDDSNGKVITANNDVLIKGEDTEIKTMTTADEGCAIWYYAPGHTLTIEDGEIFGSDYAIYHAEGDITINGGALSIDENLSDGNRSGIYSNSDNADDLITITDGTITSESHAGISIAHQSSASINISGGEVKGVDGIEIHVWTGDYVNNITVSGGKLTATGTGANSAAIFTGGSTNIKISGTAELISEDGSGIYFNNDDGNFGTVEVSGGEISGKYGIYAERADKVDISGGTVESTGSTGEAAVYISGETDVTVSGTAVIEAKTGNGIYGNNDNSTIDIKGGDISGYYGVKIDKAKTLDISGGEINAIFKQSANPCHVAVQVNDDTDVTISEGAVITAGRFDHGMEISNQDATFTMTGGSVTGMSGIYVNNVKTLAISGGTIAGIGNEYGLNLEAGNATISGGTFSATGSDALSIDGSAAVTVTGGTFTSARAGILLNSGSLNIAPTESTPVLVQGNGTWYGAVATGGGLSNPDYSRVAYYVASANYDGTGKALFKQSANPYPTGNTYKYAQFFAAAPTYMLTVDNGTANISAEKIQAGTKVKVNVTDDELFTEWTAEGVTLLDKTQPEQEFIMPLNDVTLTAVFEKQYTVTFNTGGGSAVTAQKVTEGKTASKPTDPTRPGYTFLGWYKTEDFLSVFDFTAPITGNTTAYANWAEVSVPVYTVTFVTGNGATAVPSQKVSSGGTISFRDAPKREGYSFTGWYDSTYTNRFDYSTPITANLTLYANWRKENDPIHYVSFETNGGTGIYTQTVVEGQKANVPTPPPEKSGYTLENWYTDTALTTVFDFDTPIVENITLYANWTLTPIVYHTVTFDTNGGDTEDFTQQVVDGNTISFVDAPKRAGYSFTGWYTDISLTESYRFDYGTAITADTDLYASWRQNNRAAYYVTFDSNGGSPEYTQTVLDGENAQEPTPTLSGYTFGGWYTDEDPFTAPFDFDTPITANITLYAYWTETPVVYHTVTFDTNGGDPYPSQEVPDGGTFTFTVAPTRAGYSFTGWHSDRDCTAAFPYTTPITADITLYARWRENTTIYRVTFDTDGGSAILPQNVFSGESALEPPVPPVKDGYTFEGWLIDDGIIYGEYDFSQPVTSDLTLVAKWEVFTGEKSPGGDPGDKPGTDTPAVPAAPPENTTGYTPGAVGPIPNPPLSASEMANIVQADGYILPEDRSILVIATLNPSGSVNSAETAADIRAAHQTSKRRNINKVFLKIPKKGTTISASTMRRLIAAAGTSKLYMFYEYFDTKGARTDVTIGEFFMLLDSSAGQFLTDIYFDTARTKQAENYAETELNADVLGSFETDQKGGFSNNARIVIAPSKLGFAAEDSEEISALVYDTKADKWYKADAEIIDGNVVIRTSRSGIIVIVRDSAE
jgi:uncharacterized repeat protein (TIGR02543 family)